MPVSPPIGSFGAKLREAREQRGLSLRQIANATKISVGALEALEHNNISRLPGGIFSRGFVRSYAIEVGLDPEETILEFLAQFPRDSVTAGHPEAQRTEDNGALESNRLVASTFLRLIVLSLAPVALVLYFGTGRISAPPPAEEATTNAAARDVRPRVPSSAVETVSEAPPALAPVRQEPSPTVSPAVSTAAPSGEGLTVGVSITRLCWVSAIVDGEKSIKGLMQPGDERTFEVRRDLIFTVGDAAAVTLTLNGAAARSLGRSGQVTTTRLTPANFKDFLLSR
jgi:cytoskeletal protein RodZ